VCIKELGFRFSTVGTFAIPIIGPKAVEDASGCACNGYTSPTDRNKRSTPFLVAECRLAFENDMSSFIEIGQIKSSTR